jgi:hypothetical protein
MEEKAQYGIRLPEIKGEVIKKELENAYKMIRQYEYEINKRKRMDGEGGFVEQYVWLDAGCGRWSGCSGRRRSCRRSCGGRWPR